jgi:hypothetical protein
MCFRCRADDHVFVEETLEVAGKPVDDAVLFHLEVSDLVSEIKVKEQPLAKTFQS